MEKKIKIGLIGLVIIVVLASVWFITTKKGSIIEPITEEKEEEEKDWVITSEDELLKKLEESDKKFKRQEISNTIVYWHQRMIDDAIVEGDYINYQFDKDTKELKKKIINWRDDLPEHLPSVIPKEQAESIAGGGSATLYFISPESSIFPIKSTPKNPCWVVWKVAGTYEGGSYYDIIVIDAVEGKILGYGIPPP